MATTIKPLHDRVIIRRIDDASDKTAGGLFIPDTAFFILSMCFFTFPSLAVYCSSRYAEERIVLKGVLNS